MSSDLSVMPWLWNLNQEVESMKEHVNFNPDNEKAMQLPFRSHG